MAESDEPVEGVRDAAPKPSSPRASPAKFDRAMVEAKMRSDGWVTTEKARQNAAEGSSRTTDKYYQLHGDPKTYRSLPEVARAYYPDLIGPSDEKTTQKKKTVIATTLRKRDRDAAESLVKKFNDEEKRCAAILDDDEDSEELRASLTNARWAARRAAQAIDAHEPPFLLDAARRPPTKRDYTVRCKALLGSGIEPPRQPGESDEAVQRKRRAKALRDRKWTRPIPCQLPAPPWPSAKRLLEVRSKFDGQRAWKALGDQPFSSLASVSQPFWARFDGDRIPNVQPGSRYVRVRLKSKRLRIASHPTLAAVPLEELDAGVHAAVRAAHAALGRVARARRAKEAVRERVDVASDSSEDEQEDDPVVDISGFKYEPRVRDKSPPRSPVRELDMMDDDDDGEDMLCHMAGKLTSTTFEGTWAFERTQPLRWPFAFQIAESTIDEHGARVLELKGSFEGGGLTAPVADAFSCTIQKNGQIDGKGRSKFGPYSVRGVLAYDGEEVSLTKRPPHKQRVVTRPVVKEEDDDEKLRLALSFENEQYRMIYDLFLKGIEDNVLLTASYFKKLEDQKIVSFVSNLESNEIELSYNWIQKYNIYTKSESDNIYKSVMNSIYNFKYHKVDALILKIKKEIKEGNSADDELLNLLGEQMSYERIKKKRSR